MTDPSKEVMQAALEWLHKLEARDASRRAEDASCWVAWTFDPETKRSTLHGPFFDPVTALKWAQVEDDTFNAQKGLHELPLVTQVVPVEAPEGVTPWPPHPSQTSPRTGTCVLCRQEPLAAVHQPQGAVMSHEQVQAAEDAEAHRRGDGTP